MTEKLFVRFSTPADEQAIFDFYQSNPHNFVFKRDPEVWKERISSGAVTIIEDGQGNIVASSISYPVIVLDAAGNDVHKWTEIGSTRVAQDGIGLFRLLLSAQLLRAFLLEPPEDRFVAEIVHANAHSKHVFLREGATAYDIPDVLAEKIYATVAPEDRGRGVDWYQIGPEAMPAFARALLEAKAAPVLTNPKTGAVFELDFSKCALFTQFRAALQKIAAADLGDAAKPDFGRGVKSRGDHFRP